MNIRQLEAFRATVQAGTVSGAAEILGVSQPAVSKFLAQLESSLGLPLFERRRNRLTLTPEGQLLYEGVERTFVSVDKIQGLADDIKAANAGEVSIACTPGLGFNLLPLAIRRFRVTHPRVSIFMKVQTTPRIEEWVAAQQFDFGLTYWSRGRSGLKSESFCKDPQALIVPRGHPLADRKVAEAKDLDGLPYIALDRTTMERHFIDKFFDSKNVRRDMVVETQFNETVSRLVELGQGAAVVDSFTAYGFRQRGGIVIGLKPRLDFDVSLLIPTHRPVSRAARQFLTTLKACRDDILRGGSVS